MKLFNSRRDAEEEMMTENEITGDRLDASIKLQTAAVTSFGMSTPKEGFLCFVNNYPDPARCASASLREKSRSSASFAFPRRLKGRSEPIIEPAVESCRRFAIDRPRCASAA